VYAQRAVWRNVPLWENSTLARRHSKIWEQARDRPGGPTMFLALLGILVAVESATPDESPPMADFGHAFAEKRITGCGRHNPSDSQNHHQQRARINEWSVVTQGFTRAFSLTWPSTVSTTYSMSRQFFLDCRSFVFLRTNSLKPSRVSLAVSSPACFLACRKAS